MNRNDIEEIQRFYRVLNLKGLLKFTSFLVSVLNINIYLQIVTKNEIKNVIFLGYKKYLQNA